MCVGLHHGEALGMGQMHGCTLKLEGCAQTLLKLPAAGKDISNKNASFDDNRNEQQKNIWTIITPWDHEANRCERSRLENEHEEKHRERANNFKN
jgi:hypothetical protein